MNKEINITKNMDKNWCGSAPLWLFFTFFTLFVFTNWWFKSYLFNFFLKKYKNKQILLHHTNLFWHYFMYCCYRDIFTVRDSSLGSFIKERRYFLRITFIVILLCNSIFFFFLVYDPDEHDFFKLVVVYRTF